MDAHYDKQFFSFGFDSCRLCCVCVFTSVPLIAGCDNNELNEVAIPTIAQKYYRIELNTLNNTFAVQLIESLCARMISNVTFSID